MATSTHRTDSSAGNTLALTAILFLLVLAAPGVVTAFWVDRALDLGLDRGALWAWGAAGSAGLLIAFSVHAGSALAGFARYVWCAFAVVGFVALAHYGAHAAWPAALFDQAWPR
jgi:hypothetical protein